jgi:hypothetical protein
MKKVLIILAILVLPLSAMAMTSLSDNEMANVTAQSGVTIDIIYLHMSFKFDTISWGDYDGFGTTYEEPMQYITFSTSTGYTLTEMTNSGYMKWYK